MTRRIRLRISEVKVRTIEGNDKFKAWVTLTFDEQFRIHGLKIIQGKDGPFVAMPSRQLPNGDYVDTAYPISNELREVMHRTILMEYEKQSR